MTSCTPQYSYHDMHQKSCSNDVADQQSCAL